MSLKSRFKAELIGHILAAACLGLLSVILARLLTPDSYGLLFFAISFLSVLKIFTKLGISKSAARYIAEFKEKNATQLPHIIRASLVYNIISTIIVIIMLLFTYEYLSEFVGEPDIAPYLLLGTVYLLFGTLTTYARDVLQGFEAITFSSLVNVIDRGSRLLFATGFVILGYGAFGAFGGYILASIIASVSGLLIIYFRFYRIQESAKVVQEDLYRRIAEYAVPLTATNTANVLDHRVDTILVGFFLTPVAVSYYVIGKQAVDLVEVPVSALGFTLSPTLGAKKAGGSIDQAAQIYETALINSLLVYIPAGAGLILVAEPFIEMVFGTEYRGAIPVLQIFGLYVVVEAATTLTSNGLDYLGRARSRAIVKGLTALLNVILNILLIPTIGVVGAAIATVITYSIYTIANIYMVYQELHFQITRVLRKTIVIMMITAIMSVVVLILVEYIQGWVTLFITVFIGVAIWAILSILVGFLDIQKFKSVLN
jgi:O-antigen/teichoic acid export membrane protein